MTTQRIQSRHIRRLADNIRTQGVLDQREADRQYVSRNRGSVKIEGLGRIDPQLLADRIIETRAARNRADYEAVRVSFWAWVASYGMDEQELRWQAQETWCLLEKAGFDISWDGLQSALVNGVARHQQAAQAAEEGAVSEFSIEEAGRVIGSIRWNAVDGYTAYSRRVGMLGAAESYDEAETLVREAERLRTIDAVVCQIGGLVFDVRLVRRKKWMRELDASEVAQLVRGSVFVFSGSVHPRAKALIRDLVSQRRPEDLGGCVVLARPKPGRSGGGAQAVGAELALALA